MINSVLGTKPFQDSLEFHNAESTANIPAGSPIAFVMNATGDGIDAVLPSTAGQAKCQVFFAGVCVNGQGVAAGAYGRAQVFGLVQSVIIIKQSRGASTDSWATAAALSTGQLLTVDTVNNGFAIAVSTQKIVTNATTDTIALDYTKFNNPTAALAQSLASAAGSASTSTDTRVAVTVGLKAFVRAM